MNARARLVAVTLAALALAAPAAAQERPAFGIGIGIEPFADTPFFEGGAVGRTVPTVQIYFPLQVAPNLRIEPSFGVFTRNRPGPQADTSDLTLGVGVFLTSRISPPLDLHVGGRLKLNFVSIDTTVGDDSGTDLSIAAALGGEYYLAPRFSLGLEAQLGRYQNSDVSGDDSGFFTTGLAFLRVYL
jgi:hypothetical protein